MNSPLPIAVLLSGSGRTLENFLLRIENEGLPVCIVAVASDRVGVRGLEIAEAAGIPTRVFARSEYADRIQRDGEMLGWVCAHGPNLLCLAGYLSLLDLRESVGLPVLNIHPALLPAYGGKGYYGHRVHAAVLEQGESHSGATVHLVNERFDEGALLAQIHVPVLEGDDVESLADRVFAAECKLYPTVLRWCATGELRFESGRPVGSSGEWVLRTLTPRG